MSAPSRLSLPDQRLATTSAALVAITIVVLGAVAGSMAFSEVPAGDDELFALDGTSGQVLVQILSRNLSAALLLFSGYVTMGLTTVLALTLISMYVGSSGHAIMSHAGSTGIDPLAWVYIALEFSGLLIVATAGLIPLCATLLRWLGDRAVPRGFATGRSLRLLAVGLCLILAGALVETLVIVQAR